MTRGERTDWVIACGGFHGRGGMDRANAALAECLVDRGDTVHLVAHDVDPRWLEDSRVTVALVPRTAGSYVVGELALERRSRRIVRTLRSEGARPRVIANGGNVAGADLNWVHFVHHASACADDGAPQWFRLKNRATKAWSRWRERRAIRTAAMVVTNSQRTTAEVIAWLGVAPQRVHTVYLGSDPAWRPPSSATRAAARQRWSGADASLPLIAFVGALGHDARKGIDILLVAWARLQTAGWRASLVVAGSGNRERWQQLAQRCGDSIRFVGPIDDVGSLLDASDLLVSPVRYEAYGLAAHEAVCRGVPTVITASAGIAERLPVDVSDLLLPDPPTVESVVATLRRWAADPDAWRRRFEAAAETLHVYDERDMARRIVNLISAGAR